jgi:hypothetical protein
MNNQQYFWAVHQQSTSKIMAKSTINNKVCSPLITVGKIKRVPQTGVQKVGTAGTAGAGQTTFGWTK